MSAAPAPIIERLKKLIAMADRGTEHEAALASERMQALLQEFNLTRADVESRGEDVEETAATAKRERMEHDRSAIYVYQRQLMTNIAENNFCMHFIRTRRVKTGKINRWGDYETQRRTSHLLIGRSENVQATILMYDYLIDTMHRLLPSNIDKRSSEAKLWLLGCSETLCERLHKQRTGKEKEQESDGTPGLVRLADLYGDEHDLNQDFRKGVDPGTTARERRERQSEMAEIERKQKELTIGGMDADDAWYVARGEEVPTSREPAQIEKETPSQRRRREEAEAKREDREHDRWRRERWKESAKRASPSFRAGKAKGHDIGLGGSIGGGAKAIE